METPPASAVAHAVARPLLYSDDPFILLSLSVVLKLAGWDDCENVRAVGSACQSQLRTPYRVAGNIFYQRRENMNLGCDTFSDGGGRSLTLCSITHHARQHRSSSPQIPFCPIVVSRPSLTLQKSGRERAHIQARKSWAFPLEEKLVPTEGTRHHRFLCTGVKGKLRVRFKNKYTFFFFCRPRSRILESPP